MVHTAFGIGAGSQPKRGLNLLLSLSPHRFDLPERGRDRFGLSARAHSRILLG